MRRAREPKNGRARFVVKANRGNTVDRDVCTKTVQIIIASGRSGWLRMTRRGSIDGRERGNERLKTSLLRRGLMGNVLYSRTALRRKDELAERCI